MALSSGAMNRLTAALVASLFVAACTSDTTEPRDSSDDYAAISKLDSKDAIARANEWRVTKPDVMTFVTPQELDVKFPDGREVKLPLPASEMFIAIAPYVDKTHVCATHYISKCDGEMKLTTFRVTAKDESGAVAFERDVTSLDNGFFELWLPRGKTFNMHIAQGARAADVSIATASDSPTCISTAQLK